MISAVVRPVWLALYQGEADPPQPRTRWLAPRMPRWLALLPSPRLDLVQTAGLVLAVIAFFVTFSQGAEWDESAASVSLTGHYLMAAAVALPIALRDRWPLWAWRTAFLSLPYSVWGASSMGLRPPYTFLLGLSYLLVTYSVAVRCERRITIAVWALSVLAAWIIHPNSMVVATVLVTVTVLFGHNVRVRRSVTARLVVEERRTQEAIGAQSVLEERARIARELHDVVAHHMSVIAIQAEAVPLKAAGDPAQLEAGLADIRALSLEAIAQLRQVLGVLRDEDGRTDTTPQPGLDRVEELIANARTAGLVVLAKLPDSLEGLPTAAGLSAYRIVQESLSNAMRHAPGAMDVRMPVMDGLEATRRLLSSGVPSKVLILTTFDLDDYVYTALRAGASGFLLKAVCAKAVPGLPVSDLAVFGSPGLDAPSATALTRRRPPAPLTSASAASPPGRPQEGRRSPPPQSWAEPTAPPMRPQEGRRSPPSQLWAEPVTPPVRLWAGLGGDDWIRFVPKVRFGPLGLGTDPMDPDYGARIFEVGPGGHSDYFRPGTPSLRNLTLIALGRPDEVTRAPDSGA